MKFFQVKDARNLSGLRLALSAGVPGPYGEAAKALFKIRGVEYIPVFQEIGGLNHDCWRARR